MTVNECIIGCVDSTADDAPVDGVCQCGTSTHTPDGECHDCHRLVLTDRHRPILTDRRPDLLHLVR